MINEYLIAIAITIIVTGIIYILSKLKKRIYKFIPSIILLILSIVLVIEAEFFAIGWDKLVYLVLSIMVVPSCIISFIVAFIFDITRKKIV